MTMFPDRDAALAGVRAAYPSRVILVCDPCSLVFPGPPSPFFFGSDPGVSFTDVSIKVNCPSCGQEVVATADSTIEGSRSPIVGFNFAPGDAARLRTLVDQLSELIDADIIEAADAAQLLEEISDLAPWLSAVVQWLRDRAPRLAAGAVLNAILGAVIAQLMFGGDGVTPAELERILQERQEQLAPEEQQPPARPEPGPGPQQGQGGGEDHADPRGPSDAAPGDG